MNGSPLRSEHGAPFRLIVPHWYGMASVKWLKRIEVSAEAFEGEFQTSHYMYEWGDQRREPVTSMRVRARITDPAPRSRMPAGHYTVRGKAWTGTGPVTSVEVSVAGGNDWQRANLEPAGKPVCSGRTGPSTGTRPASGGTHCVPAPPTLPETYNPTSRPGTASATATTPSKSSTWTSTNDIARVKAPAYGEG